MADIINKRIGSFGDSFNPKKNSFGFLRLLLSMLVLYSHTFTLGGFGAEPLLGFTQGRVNLGALAVMSFFVLSGFLITRSMVVGQSTINFLWNRALRILPGYWVCTLLTILLFMPLITSIEGKNLWDFTTTHSDSIFSYITNNWFLTMRQWGVGDLLQNNPHKGALNGSLWSLIYEWQCYLLIAILGLFAAYKRAFLGLAVLLFVFSTINAVSMANGRQPIASGYSVLSWFADANMSKLAPYFLCASLFLLFRTKIPNHIVIFVVSLILVRYALRENHLATIGTVALCYAVLWLAFNLPEKLSWFDRVGDVSYGVYIYAFPVQQTLAAMGVPKFGFTAYFLLSTALTLVLSVLSYKFVEQPVLALKKIDLSSEISSRFGSIRRRVFGVNTSK